MKNVFQNLPFKFNLQRYTAGWCGGSYEVSSDGEVSHDLLMVLSVALADPDDPAACDPTTGLPPGGAVQVELSSTHTLKAPDVSQPLISTISTLEAYEVKTWIQNLLFQMQLLYRYTRASRPATTRCSRRGAWRGSARWNHVDT